jgi:hypothetical protein
MIQRNKAVARLMTGSRSRSRPGKSLGRLGLVAAASTAVLGGLAAPSYAAGPTAFVTAGNDVHYVGNGFTNRVLVSTDLPRTVLLEEPVNGISPGPGCARVTSSKVRCAAPASGPSVDFVRLDLGGGHDEAKVQTSIRTTVLGGAGNDRYFGASSSTGTSVTFDGGADEDGADYGFSTSGVLVDLDGQQDDGRLGRDSDNILTSVENLFGSDHDDSLRGNSSRNWIIGRLGADAMRGGSGDDELWAHESNRDGSEADKADLSCGKGFDSIILDTVDPGTAECEEIRQVS